MAHDLERKRMTAPTVGVCGFGRCGSSMAMAMLDAGGLPPVKGSQPVSYEVPDHTVMRALSAGQLAGRAVKLLDDALYALPPAAHEWRFVWLDRDPVQQARSALKLMHAVVGFMPTAQAEALMAESYRSDRPEVLGLLRRIGPVTVLRYERVLANPAKAAKRLRAVFPGIDVAAAATVVHDRDGTCRPDLAFEMSEPGGTP